MEETVILAVGLIVLGYSIRGLAGMLGDQEASVALRVMGGFLVIVGLTLLSLMFVGGLPVNISVSL